jgi:hypothetical protein
MIAQSRAALQTLEIETGSRRPGRPVDSIAAIIQLSDRMHVRLTGQFAWNHSMSRENDRRLSRWYFDLEVLGDYVSATQ